MSIFRIVILAVFAIFALVGVLIFSGVIDIGDRGPAGVSGEVVLWGTVPQQTISKLLEDINRENKNIVIKYRQKSEEVIDEELIEAWASGTGPDLFFLSQDSILKHRRRILPVPYESLPQGRFKEIFVGEGELYLGSEGVLAFPLIIDPMVMYYNRTIFENAGIAVPPSNWDEFVSLAPRLTSKNPAGTITQSAVALGTFDNIVHAKDIISMLLLQLGNPIVTRTKAGLRTELKSSFGFEIPPANAVIDFYTDFSDPLSTVYCWNRAMPSSLDAFVAGDLGVYFGFASELFDIERRNPNLNFGVVRMPVPRNVKAQITFGKMQALAISRFSQNPQAAYFAITLLTSADFIGDLSDAMLLPPVRRDVLAEGAPGTTYLPLFYSSALQARGWLDPDPEKTEEMFKEMMDAVSTGRLKTARAVNEADGALDILLRQVIE